MRSSDISSRIHKGMLSGILAASVALYVGDFDRTAAAAEVKIGYTPIMEVAPLLYAIDAGFFEREGIEASTVVFQSGGAMTAAMLGGSINVQAKNGNTILVLIEKGQDVRGVAQLVNRTRLELVARRDVPIEYGDVKGLRGKKIGIASLGGGVQDLLNYILLEAGLDPKTDVTQMPLGAGAPMLAGLKQGTVDLMLNNEPYITQGIEVEKFAKRVLDVAVDGPGKTRNLSGIVLQSTTDWINANRETVAGMIRAIGNAQAAMRSDPEKAAELLQSHFDGMDAEILKLILERQAKYWHTAITKENADADNAMSLALGRTSKAVPYEDYVVDEGLQAEWQ